MSWAYRIARVSGIDIKIHITFLLILLLGGMQWGRLHGTAGCLRRAVDARPVHS
jgi:hypothetical protein